MATRLSREIMSLVWGQNHGSGASPNLIGACTDKSGTPRRREQGPAGGSTGGRRMQSQKYKSLKTKQLSPYESVMRVPKRDSRARLARAFCSSLPLSRIGGDGTLYGREVSIPPRFKSGYWQADKAT